MEKLTASRAERLMACPGSADLAASIPGWQPPVVDDTMGMSSTGAHIHELLHGLFQLKTETKSSTKKFSAKDMQHLASALSYIADVWSGRRFSVLSEESVTVDWLDPSIKTTADVVFYTKDELHVIDLKWGQIPVEVVGNAQLLYYACSYAPYAPNAESVTVHIVQPKADNMVAWTISVDELALFMDEVRAAHKKIIGGDLTHSPGDHCLFCPAYPHARTAKGKPLCPEAMELLYSIAPVDMNELLKE